MSDLPASTERMLSILNDLANLLERRRAAETDATYREELAAEILMLGVAFYSELSKLPLPLQAFCQQTASRIVACSLDKELVSGQVGVSPRLDHDTVNQAIRAIMGGKFPTEKQ